jgi:hypothetical protein
MTRAVLTMKLLWISTAASQSWIREKYEVDCWNSQTVLAQMNSTGMNMFMVRYLAAIEKMGLQALKLAVQIF